MSNQAQVDALEHLLLAMLRRNGVTLQAGQAFEDAQASVMGSDGPGGNQEKTAAFEYLQHLRRQTGR